MATRGWSQKGRRDFSATQVEPALPTPPGNRVWFRRRRSHPRCDSVPSDAAARHSGSIVKGDDDRPITRDRFCREPVRLLAKKPGGVFKKGAELREIGGFSFPG